VAADGSGLRLVHHSDAAILIPDWSPDGQTLVYEDHQDADGEVYAVALDGSNERNLTRNSGVRDALGGPTVAPDGSIIYAAAANQSAAFITVIRERLGVAALLIQGMLIAVGAALLFIRGSVPFGALAVMIGVATAVALAWFGAWAFLPLAIGSGLVADLANRLTPRTRLGWAVTLGTLTGGFALAYFLTIAVTVVVAWPAGWWSASPAEVPNIGYPEAVILLAVGGAAAIGLLVGFVSGGSSPRDVLDGN
jgi:hypothetical protein